ncbi:MAG: arginine--tRNA ligase [Saprospiraceae bacterium]
MSFMNIISIIEEAVVQGVQTLYGIETSVDKVAISNTRKEFVGDYTVVVFPFTKLARKNPVQVGEELGTYLVEQVEWITEYNVIKGFLNLVVSDLYWQDFLLEMVNDDQYGYQEPTGKKVMVEFSSPNTNKPLHLGHIRNILLGWSSAKILEAAGNEVVKVQIVNDRGIAICKSMLAWQKFGDGATPESTNLKSDHFVGKYYVLFETKFKAEYAAWQETDSGKAIYEAEAKEGQDTSTFFKAYKNTYFNQFSPLGKEAKAMLVAWEAEDKAVRALWEKMNSWVYEGFGTTYDRLGVSFDKLYYESETYLLGKDTIEQGLKEDVFYQKEDNSVWIDLTDVKLDQKLVLRSDGTAVYMTQDIGTAELRYRDFGVDKMVYVVADEQNYHFQVLFEIMKKLKAPYADGLFHLSYGMVDLPTGKMKSREGTVVDADDLMEEVIGEARKNSVERGTFEDMSQAEQDEITRKIGLAALKFFIIKVHPKKRMTFNPKDSVDMQGQTGPYVQNAYVRIRSVLRKAGDTLTDIAGDYKKLAQQEKSLVLQLFDFPAVIRTAAAELDPASVANYCYNLAKGYHKFYTDLSILNAETAEAKAFRIQLSKAVAQTLKTGMELLGIEMPEKM